MLFISNLLRQKTARYQALFSVRVNHFFEEESRLSASRRSFLLRQPLIERSLAGCPNKRERLGRHRLPGSACLAPEAQQTLRTLTVEAPIITQRLATIEAMLKVGQKTFQAQQPEIEIQERPRDLARSLERPKHGEHQTESAVINFALREIALGNLGNILGGDLHPIILLHIEEGLEQLGGIHPQQVAILALKEPEPDVTERLQRAAVTALGAARARGHCPQPAPLARENRDNLVRLSQTIGSEDNGFCFTERHSFY